MKQVASWPQAVAHIREQNPDVVSFDIFDTLLLRKFHPDVVLQRVALWLDAQRGTEVGTALQDFHRLYQAQATQRQQAGLDHEVDGERLFSAWGGPHTAELLNFYLEVECEALQLNQVYHQFLQELAQEGKQVLIISDMYLPVALLRRLLQHFGYQGAYSQLFVSSEAGLLKRTGRLFHHVRKVLSIQQEARWVHTGDSIEADGVQAVGAGVAAVVNPHVHWQGNVSLPEGPQAGETVYRALSRPCLDFWESYGFYRLGPIFASFIHGVHAYAVEHQLSALIFPAREGLFLKELYQAFLATTGKAGPPGHYAYLSRAATLYYGGGADAYSFDCLRQNGARSLAALTRHLLEDEAVAAVAQRLGVPADEALPPARLSTLITQLLTDTTVQAAGARKQAATERALTPYLSALGFFNKDSALGFVDVGWGAQIQYSLYRGLGNAPAELHGLYMGINRAALARQGATNFVCGVLTTQTAMPWEDRALFEFPALVELACRAPHGTVVRLDLDSTGTPQPVLRDSSSASRRKEMQDEHVLAHLQAGILAYVQGYAQIWRQSPFNVEHSREFALRMAERCIRYPSAEEIAEIRKLTNIADLGSEEGLTLDALWWPVRHAHRPVKVRQGIEALRAFKHHQSAEGPAWPRLAKRAFRSRQGSLSGGTAAQEEVWQAQTDALRRMPLPTGAAALKPVPPAELAGVRALDRWVGKLLKMKKPLGKLRRLIGR